MELYQYIIIMVVLLIIALAIVKMNKKNINIAEFKALSDIATETGLLKEDKIDFDDLGKIVEAIKIGI